MHPYTSKSFYYFCSRGNEITWAADLFKMVNKITLKEPIVGARCFILLKRYSTKFRWKLIWQISQAKSRKYRGVFQAKIRKKRHGQFEIISLNNLSISKSQKFGTELGVRKGKRSLLACHIRCKYSMETTRNLVPVKVNIGNKVIKLVENLIGCGITVHCNRKIRMSFSIRERETSYWSPYQP